MGDALLAAAELLDPSSAPPTDAVAAAALGAAARALYDDAEELEAGQLGLGAQLGQLVERTVAFAHTLRSRTPSLVLAIGQPAEAERLAALHAALALLANATAVGARDSLVKANAVGLCAALLHALTPAADDDYLESDEDLPDTPRGPVAEAAAFRAAAPLVYLAASVLQRALVVVQQALDANAVVPTLFLASHAVRLAQGKPQRNAISRRGSRAVAPTRPATGGSAPDLSPGIIKTGSPHSSPNTAASDAQLAEAIAHRCHRVLLTMQRTAEGWEATAAEEAEQRRGGLEAGEGGELRARTSAPANEGGAAEESTAGAPPPPADSARKPAASPSLSALHSRRMARLSAFTEEHKDTREAALEAAAVHVHTGPRSVLVRRSSAADLGAASAALKKRQKSQGVLQLAQQADAHAHAGVEGGGVGGEVVALPAESSQRSSASPSASFSRSLSQRVSAVPLSALHTKHSAPSSPSVPKPAASVPAMGVQAPTPTATPVKHHKAFDEGQEAAHVPDALALAARAENSLPLTPRALRFRTATAYRETDGPVGGLRSVQRFATELREGGSCADYEERVDLAAALTDALARVHRDEE
ncbi:hypothetical protein T492DRAFT_885068, partial [Pavlovales sp. CCMP2436]